MLHSFTEHCTQAPAVICRRQILKASPFLAIRPDPQIVKSPSPQQTADENPTEHQQSMLTSLHTLVAPKYISSTLAEHNQSFRRGS
ncbi:uncharacterized protein MYCFIDRAFT_177981 [Pseudocercospora fijiensis CIRAD86]|uniref:Uncharacterized protein n=1 Tax=Pseudocercospora fijiensis (strain CIRAD86) TaxID=383855 RepID=M2ZJU7_PSEFD|nr:uncharacterized protein MYCFIDRAFT_177981 [Pseudocercospora fijiensis CIRAD86]EME79379.1 hypothetical protein MYCFIDRAFT_177981 [Pseudocercospora fijiensis CIRAD86]